MTGSKMANNYLFFVILLFSCSYQNGQEEIINKISNNSAEIYSKSFETKISKKFSIKELENLTNDKNPGTRIYFYNYLIKHHPSYCFAVCLNHLKDSARVSTSTSYDTQEYLSIGELMITKGREENVFSSQQNESLDSLIFLSIKKYPHLEGVLYSYLYKNQKKPRIEFYYVVKDLIIHNNQKPYFSQISLIKYFSNYNIKTDSILIKNYLLISLKRDSTIYFNSALEFIKENPKSEYFEILINFYNQNILGEITRCDECFFELKLFCEAISKFPNAETIVILNTLITNKKYISQCDYLAKNEQFYYVLKKANDSYYQQILKSLEHKIDMHILASVEKYYN